MSEYEPVALRLNGFEDEGIVDGIDEDIEAFLGRDPELIVGHTGYIKAIEDLSSCLRDALRDE